MVRLESEKHIDFAPNSPFGGGRPGRVARKRAGNSSEGIAEDEAQNDDE